MCTAVGRVTQGAWYDVGVLQPGLCKTSAKSVAGSGRHRSEGYHLLAFYALISLSCLAAICRENNW